MPSTNTTSPPTNPALFASQPLVEWWAQQWIQGITPMTRLQLAWMESMSDMMQQEARFIAALSAAGQQLGQCYETHGHDPEKIQECYEEIAREVAEHHMQRIKQVASLPQEFRRRIWEEL
ncbi:MAG: hypothetical protein LPK20_17070 [Halomonas sp.]|jgi:hypothetical protein|uniref:Uncharacterized protein n=1 Tax=Billgrantia tianxiuensis TaxID=2497861 RepID=A0A6I6SM10_9GAMM|nr:MULTISPECIES: hypothetical protein [Halomonas]MCE8031603.1 hypothetical protein [Halomonas sp. MCCC 1A11057]MDX5435269.1 hypothetical protein [Halomonas sp.]QHC50251.1 hypothetical protein EKK97_12540 [Halomonas tianxiuensis]